MPQATLKEARDEVADAATAALEGANGNVIDAAKALETRVRNERKLRDALTDPLIANACYDAVRSQCHVQRRKIWTPPAEKLVKSKVEGAHRVVQLASGTLLMFPLPGGKPLGQATREEITAAAERYGSQSKDMGEKARWLQLIAQSIPANKKAGEVLTEKRLRELQKEARDNAN
jgi:hypothetical protein